MNYAKYYEARKIITEIMRKDLLGPVYEDEIIIGERPLEYYLVGKLYPQNYDNKEEVTSSTEDVGEMDAENYDNISLSNNNNPSSFGISFSLLKDTLSFYIEIEAAKYLNINYSDAKKILNFDDKKFNGKTPFWKRVSIRKKRVTQQVCEMEVGKNIRVGIEKNLSLNIYLHKIYDDGTKTITATLVNDNKVTREYTEDCLNSYFQPRILVGSTEKSPVFSDIRKNILVSNDPELLELNLLYSKTKNYAAGHGCAVTWHSNDDGNAVSIKSEFLPFYEINQMKANTSNNKIFSMRYLSEAPLPKIISGLRVFINEYGKWISKQVELSKKYGTNHNEAISSNLKRCDEALTRLGLALKAMEEDKTVFKAFKLANKAMFLQRKKMLQNTRKYKNDEDIRWYPFQLAFFLQQTYSFAKPESDDRKKVDLLWFPTGGGKTEAYLGIAAFCIFLRRLRFGSAGDGVTVIMRYTMRLLSFQQFERAAALVMACELIRKKEKIEGGEIGVALWVGSALTPNTIKDAKSIMDGEKNKYSETSNPAQISKCLWCDSPIPAEAPYYEFIPENHRMLIKCTNKTCEFSTGLPLYLIDEEIYHHKPSYIIATVDKFAQLALSEKTFSIFGLSNNKKPPELIIQDELHLISGPLGTITGIYEAAIKKLCEQDGFMPKVVASTATIRNAEEQVRALYATGYYQFPPQALDINDSFFASIASREEKPSRLYMGCMSIGTSPTTMMIRVMSSLLFASRYLTELNYDDNVIDSFWTLTGYFNTLRELGGAIVRVVDDIQDRMDYLRKSKFLKAYPLKSKKRYDNYKELTSRESGENIGNVIQNELKIPYKKDGSTNPFDFLLSSNMISVGVDVGRLGTMVVVGQPKSTAEYIQATSRVGRETPGLVIATYNQAKSRDRSHYEQFRQYHETYYKYVEATSLTPFADRARDRALQALYIILCRYMVPALRADNAAAKFDKSIGELKNIKKYLLDYVKIVDPDEYGNVMKELGDIESEWENRARKDNLRYNDYFNPDKALFDPDYKEGSRFRVLNTMRSVETSVEVTMEE